MGMRRRFLRDRIAGIDDDGRAARADALVAHIGHGSEGLAGGFIIAQHSHKFGRQCRGRAVEKAQFPALVTKEAQRREHPIDCRNQPRRHLMAEIHISLAKRQQLHEKIENGARIARNMPAVRQDLAVQFAIEAGARALYNGERRGQREAGHRKRDANAHDFQSVAGCGSHRAQVIDMHADAFQEPAIETELRRLQNDGGM